MANGEGDTQPAAGGGIQQSDTDRITALLGKLDGVDARQTSLFKYQQALETRQQLTEQYVESFMPILQELQAAQRTIELTAVREATTIQVKRASKLVVRAALKWGQKLWDDYNKKVDESMAMVVVANQRAKRARLVAWVAILIAAATLGVVLFGN